MFIIMAKEEILAAGDSLLSIKNPPSATHREMVVKEEELLPFWGGVVKPLN